MENLPATHLGRYFTSIVGQLALPTAQIVEFNENTMLSITPSPNTDPKWLGFVE
jgi:hypothetical protein